MKPITKKTKSNIIFQKMRAHYLGDIKKKHPTEQLYGQRNKSVLSWGFNEYILNKYIWQQIKRLLNQGKYLGNLLLVNDYTFEATNYLISRLNPKAITVAFIVENEADKCHIQKWVATYFEGTDQLTIVYIYKDNSVQKIKELKMHDKFNLILSNPPYGSVGANITKEILTEVKFDYYINLLPANDYKRNTEKDLFNYQSDMIPIINGFKGDAAVTTHLARIHSTKVNNMTLVEFERSQYIDRNLDKYFEENSKRTHYAIENDSFCSNCKKYSNEFTVILGWRDVNHKAMPKSKDSTTYKWNVEKSIDADYVFNNHEKVTNGKRTGRVSFAGITFNTATEKDNFVEFFYSESGRHFMSKLWSSMNVDGGLFIEKWFPKVDWTRPWTVEEILKDYGYTEDEIKTVMADLDNFKGMED